MPNSSTKHGIVNTKDVAQLIKEPLIKKIHGLYGVPPNWQRPEGFETLVQIILEQQVSLASARAHFKKLKSGIGKITPKNILALTDAAMRANHISKQKATYLRALSEAVINKKLDINNLSKLNEQQVREQLTNIKGIGNWTTDVYLMFCLHYKDVFPIGDIALVNTIKEFTDIQNKDKMVFFSERWKPLRSLATYFLWHYYLNKRNRTFID